MAWTTISTFTAGAVLTAAQMNQVRLNGDFEHYPPTAKATLTTPQSIPATTNTWVIFDTQEIDTAAMFAPPSNTITIGTAGIYLVSSTIVWSSAPTASYLTLEANAATPANGTVLAVANTVTPDDRMTATSIASLAAATTIRVALYQTNVGALNVGNGLSWSVSLSVAYLGTPL